MQSISVDNKASVELIGDDVIEEYYIVKLKLSILLRQEELLKDKIKRTMTINNISSALTDKIDLFCKKAERVFYPKEKIEEYVPREILERIKTIKEIIILTAKIKKF